MNISKNHPRIIGLACATTGLNLEVHHPIGIALRIIESDSGNILADYHALIKISEEDWQKRDVRSDLIHRITWENLQNKGESLDKIREDIGIILKVNNMVQNAFFVSFNIDFHISFFRKILGGNRLIVPEENFSEFLFKRTIQDYKRKLELKTIENFEMVSDELGWHNYPRLGREQQVGIPYKRTTCLRLLELAEMPGPKDHIRVVNDICRVVKGLIEQG